MFRTWIVWLSVSSWTAITGPSRAQAIAPEGLLKAPVVDAVDQFGWSVALSGDTLVVGVPRESSQATGVGGNPNDNGADNSGAVHVFVRSGSEWAHQAYLKASNTDESDQFGGAVAIAGDTIVVGSEYEQSQATGVDGDQLDDSVVGAGAVYAFVRTGTTWSQQAYLKPASTVPNAYFGHSVSLDGDTLAIGAYGEPDVLFNAGAVYVFERSGTDWSQQARLTSSSPSTDAFFGVAVDVSGDRLAVGAHGQNSPFFNAGAAYVFDRVGTTWSESELLTASNAGDNDQFGWSLALDADTLVVGAWREDSAALGVGGNEGDDGSPTSGAAYVFAFDGTAWDQQAYLKASNTGPSDWFGWSTAVRGDTVVVGALGEDGGAVNVDGPTGDAIGNSGAAYVYRRTGTDWASQAYLKPSNTGFNWAFGRALVLEGDALVVGASGEGSAMPVSGGAFTFDVDAPVAVLTYCSGKTSSAGCSTAITTSNLAAQPVSGAADYFVNALQVQGGKNGLLFVGLGAASLPFNGGTLCVQPPTKRGPILQSGSGSPVGCAGTFGTLVNDGAILPSGLDAGAGNSGWYQYWYRDPQGGAGPLGTALSDAVQLDFL